ncbi:MAG TPA: class II histone deacetylase [Lichenihabitans sp.]|jgi:acetoin utilization deacetylase AcuC-like enzyme|nr:class II histone deacetylase [Lichenihabitans sp.]
MTGYVFHERMMWHDTGSSADMMPPGPFVEPGRHLESPGSKRRLHNLVQVSGLIDHLMPIAASPVSIGDLLRVHTRDHVEAIRAQSQGGHGFAGPQAPVGIGSFDIACLSAGGTYAAFAAAASGAVDNAYALVRPPGHHAEPGGAMGNCLFSNIGVALRRLKAEGIVDRVAVVDWDVHHGNGTETVFYEDPSVLTISLHQDNLYPVGRGGLADRGRGAGEGFNVNIPLPAGSGSGAYEAAFDRIVLPALKAFEPDMIVVACGLDASAFDPLGRMMLDSEAYRRLTQRLMEAAAALCGGRIAMSHEGGYSEGYVPFCGLAVIETLAGVRTEAVDPLSDHIGDWAGHPLQPHQAAAIERAEAALPLLRRRLASAG